MNPDRMRGTPRDPRFISGIYNYCDRWCERCAFTRRCGTYDISQEVESHDIRSPSSESRAFWDEIHETYESVKQVFEGRFEELNLGFEEGLDDSIREQEEVREAAESLPCIRTAVRYREIVDTWSGSCEDLLHAGRDASESPVGGGAESGAGVDVRGCLEVIQWYHHLIWVKLCRAAGGALRAQRSEVDYSQEDADGSAKVALIGIERSIEAWVALQCRFPDHEDAVLALGALKRLLRQVESAFPNARAFRRPGFDTGENPIG